ncbi:MAG: hypothetical protein IH873_03365 [Chloroflexi bacterium]|nr:hypothetical protein [Chloroflexota bacterium]
MGEIQPDNFCCLYGSVDLGRGVVWRAHSGARRLASANVHHHTCNRCNRFPYIEASTYSDAGSHTHSDADSDADSHFRSTVNS